MRRSYKYLYHSPPIPCVWAADPVLTDEERRAIASRLAGQWAELRRAPIAEPWTVFNSVWMLTIEMLKAGVVGAIALARALWRRYGAEANGRRLQ